MNQQRPDAAEDLLRRPRRTVASVLPVLGWLPRYDWRALPADLVAGVALSALLIPESMGYAGVAGVPAEVGLYAALAAVVGYALTGGTSILVVGPAAAVAALSASIVADFGGDVPPVVVTSALAIVTGVLLVVAGALRLGWIVNFISRPVLHAFVAGLALSIIIGQLDDLVGVEVDGGSPLARLVDIVADVDGWHGLTALIGLGSLAVLVGLEHLAPRVPGAIVVVVIGIASVAALDLVDEGVAVVGEIPQGLPDVGVPDLSGTRWAELAAGALALLLVGFSEGYAAASSVAARTGEELDPDQELLASGTANVAAGLAGGLAVSGSLSKSAASAVAGARTQMANLVSGLVLLATLLFLAPLFEDLPEPVLAAVVIAAVLPSASPRRLLGVWSVNRLDFAAAALTFSLVLLWETLPALIVGVVLSLAFVVRRASFPDVAEVRPGADGVFRRVESDPAARMTRVVGVVALRFEAPLVYANADRLRRATRSLVADGDRPSRVVLDGEMLSDLDSTGAETLAELDEELAQSGIELHLARVHRRARAQIERSQLARRFAGRIHATIREATDVVER